MKLSFLCDRINILSIVQALNCGVHVGRRVKSMTRLVIAVTAAVLSACSLQAAMASDAGLAIVFSDAEIRTLSADDIGAVGQHGRGRFVGRAVR